MSHVVHTPDTGTLPGLRSGDHLDQKTFHERYVAAPENFKAELINGVVFVHSPAPSFAGLRSGDHLDQKKFHELYVTAPDDFKAELIEGVVIVHAAASTQHADYHSIVAAWLGVYRAATPGTQALSEPTTILGPGVEVQPDAALIIKPEVGGQTRPEGLYQAGPPELVAEVAFTSAAHDLHSKLHVYERAGVREYLVLVLHEPRVEWFVLQDGRFQTQLPEADGVFRSAVFPGLWLDQQAVLGGDVAKVLDTLQRGLATPEHADFAQQLAARG